MIEQEVESALEGKAWSPEAAALAVTLAERVKARAKGARARQRVFSARARARASLTTRRPHPARSPPAAAAELSTPRYKLLAFVVLGENRLQASLRRAAAAPRVPAAQAAATAHRLLCAPPSARRASRVSA